MEKTRLQKAKKLAKVKRLLAKVDALLVKVGAKLANPKEKVVK